MRRLLAPVSMMIAVAGCSTPVAKPPSLAPRAAEAIDPRVPVVDQVAIRPVDGALAARLAELINQATVGDAAFEEAAAAAERLAVSAGAPHSESWVAAQQAISAAQAARGPTSRALGDIDAIAATALATKGGIAPADLAAVQAAAAKVAEIDARQARRIRALQARVGT
jgi:hypothetical protein